MAKRAEKKAPKQSERLNYGEVSRELKTGGPQRLYLLYGQEDYLREAFLGELKALCLPDGGDDFSYHRLDGRTLDMRELEEAVNALPFLSERALTEVRGYDLGRCRDQAVTPDACLALIYSSGELMSGLIPEIEKLGAGVRGDTVTAQDVERMALRRPEARIFDMTDCLAARDYDGAARILADLIAMGEEPIVTVAGIGMQMRRLYAARLAIDEKLGPDFVKELYKINYGFIIDKLMRAARGFTLEALERAVELCAETDYAMKSSSADDTELLCDLLIKLAAGA